MFSENEYGERDFWQVVLELLMMTARITSYVLVGIVPMFGWDFQGIEGL